MDNSLKKIINLAKRTGDRLIVTDIEGQNAFIIMNLDEYEKVLGAKEEIRDLSEEQLLNKINRDVAIWKSSHDEESVDKPVMEEKNSKRESQEYLPSINKIFNFNKESAPKNEIEEDERFYFEPVE